MRARFVTPFILAVALILTSRLTDAQQQTTGPGAKPPNVYESTYKPLPSQTTVIRNATVLTAAGPVIERGSVLLQNGKISAVGATVNAPADAVVIDASLAVKWVLPEPDSDRADALWAEASRANLLVLSAPHFPGEVANAIYQRVRSTDPSKHLDFPDAEQALRRFRTYAVTLSDPPDLVSEAFNFAHAHGLVGVYDALYVVLGRLHDAELWTADERLLTQLAGRAPWVRRLRDYPP